MQFKLTPTKNKTGDKIHIWADIYANVFNGVHFAARPVMFRIVAHRYEIDVPDDPVKGAMLTVSVEEARKFAEELLEIAGKSDEKF